MSAEWLPLVDVLTYLGRTPAGGDGMADVEPARRAAAALVERARPELRVLDELTLTMVYVPTSDVRLAALILAARFVARRGSPMGVASFGEFGVADIVRLDPDVERLLGVGRYAPPRVG